MEDLAALLQKSLKALEQEEKLAIESIQARARWLKEDISQFVETAKELDNGIIQLAQFDVFRAIDMAINSDFEQVILDIGNRRHDIFGLEKKGGRKFRFIILARELKE